MSPEKRNQAVILWYIYCAVVPEICEMVLIFTKDIVSILVGQEKNRSEFFDIFSDLCDTL